VSTTGVDQEVAVEIVVRGRKTEVPERFRRHAVDKLDKLEKYDGRLTRIDVELTHEANPRLAAESERVEITARSKGPVIRAEASAQDAYSALDLAFGKIEGRLRRAADRRRHHRARGNGRGASGGAESLAAPVALDAEPAAVALDEPVDEPLVVREKTHTAEPMSLDQALYEMELVGHDFYLFVDEATSLPSVVYRRHGYQYGVIRLAV
jgi:ribosomal subunit interface protein